jgi:hypothetical protein
MFGAGPEDSCGIHVVLGCTPLNTDGVDRGPD